MGDILVVVNPKDYLALLVDVYYDRVYRAAWYVARDDDIALEATQEAFVKAYQNIESLKDRTRTLSWLATIAMNTAKDILRKEKWSSPRGDVEELYDKQFRILHGMGSTVEDIVLQEEERVQVRNLIRRLPIEERSLLVLKYYFDFSDGEIGQAVGRSVVSVKSRLYRIRRRLRRLVSEQGKNEHLGHEPAGPGIGGRPK